MQTMVAAYFKVLSQYPHEETERQNSRGLARAFHSINQEYGPAHPDILDVW
jgi:hypothetical protein